MGAIGGDGSFGLASFDGRADKAVEIVLFFEV